MSKRPMHDVDHLLDDTDRVPDLWHLFIFGFVAVEGR